MKFNKRLKFLTILFAMFGMVLTIPLFENKVSANTYYFELFGGAPLQQDWTNTSQITVNDDWSNVVSMQGFFGENLTATPGVDPQTITADGQTVLDVNANQTNPNSFLTGGVTEFEIANPTIALRATDTENAPHLMIYLNTTPCPVTKSISIRYNVRDIDSSTRDSVTQLALQYRIGTTGNFINVPGGFVADATEPNAATKVTPRFVNLPAHIINNPQVEIRLITANAAGDDEAIGLDDIEIGCFFPTSAEISMGGRVLSSVGQPVSRASVSIFNTYTMRKQLTRTNHFGYFNFDGLEAGGLYIVTIGHKSYRFTSAQNTFELYNDVKGLVFYADQQNNFTSPKNNFKKMQKSRFRK